MHVHYRLDTFFLGLLPLITARSFFFFSRTSIYLTSTHFSFRVHLFVYFFLHGFGFVDLDL